MADVVSSIMKAIRDQESGGDYNAANGDSGAFGAYQFMPETWNDAASQFGLNADDKSPSNQDRMAYSLMSQYYNKYQDPRAVASMWYSGQPDYSVDSDEGAYPSINNYVNSVMGKMGRGGEYNYQAYDSNNKPFLNMSAYVTANDKREPFDQRSIMNILGNQGPSLPSKLTKDYIFGPSYSEQLLTVPSDVAKYMTGSAKTLDDNRVNDIKEQTKRESLMSNLQNAVGVMSLIKNSNNIDNRRMYASLAGMAGLKVPSNDDQIMSNKELLSSQLQTQKDLRDYNFKKSAMDWEHDYKERQLAMAQAKMAASSGASGGGSRGGGGGITASQALSLIEKSNDFAQKNPGRYNPLSRDADVAQQYLDYQLQGPYSPDDFGSVSSNWTQQLERNSDRIADGGNGAWSKDQLQKYAQVNYGDFAPTILASTQWGNYNL